MKPIVTRRGRADKCDDLRCVRRDGSCSTPRHGTLELELPDA